MISNPVNSLPLKHIRKTTNGRKFSIDVEAVDNSFVSLASRKPANDYLKSLVNESWQGMLSGNSPTLSEVGVGGTYFMRDSFNRRIGVFKPHDEEMGCLNNPKGFTPMNKMDGRSKGVVVGEAAFRECAAYVLDHGHFSGVPATDLVACSYPLFNNSPSDTQPSDENFKLGSFQEFKEHDFDAEDISPSKSARFPVNEVHKIALLDIRLFNTDRHGGNILVRKIYSAPTTPRARDYGSDADENGSLMQFRLDMETLEEEDDEDESLTVPSLTSSTSSAASYYDDDAVSFELIPIDHGYTLPSTLNITDSWFEWLNWPQAKVPFSTQTKDYIASLDAESDIATLREKYGDWFHPDCYKVLRITTMWLKKGAEYDLTPYELGTRMCSLHVDSPSELETIYCEALDQTDKELEEAGQWDNIEVSDKLFYEKVASLMDEKMRKIVRTKGTSPQPKTLKYA